MMREFGATERIFSTYTSCLSRLLSVFQGMASGSTHELDIHSWIISFRIDKESIIASEQSDKDGVATH